MDTVSILWHDGVPSCMMRDFDFVGELALSDIIPLSKTRTYGEGELRLEPFFTTDTVTLSCRCEMFCELLDDVALYDGLSSSFSALSDICRLRQEKEAPHTNESMMYSIKELEMYVDYVDGMARLFSEHPAKSEFLRRLEAEIKRIAESEEYPRLRAEVQRQSHAVKNAKSITIGLNLDAQLRPLEAGVVKVNEVQYRSGEFIDKLLRLDFKDDEFTCSAQLAPTDKKLSQEEAAAMRYAVNGALGKIFSSALVSWERTVRKYVISGLDALFPLLPEWQFISACIETLRVLREYKRPLCKPQFGDYDEITGLYNPALAMSGRVPVASDIGFGDEIIYILTGPNQGGKSVFTKSVGLAYSMLHLGLPLPAVSAAVRPVDAIYVHFVDSKSDRAYKNGRLAGECEEIGKINGKITKDSLFLFDEAFSSTSADEAVVLSSEILSAYAEIGVRGICTTHLHGLCSMADGDGASSRICNLTAVLDGESHDRTYRIEKGGRYGHSYAMDIAKNFRLTREEILAMQNDRKACESGEMMEAAYEH